MYLFFSDEWFLRLKKTWTKTSSLLFLYDIDPFPFYVTIKIVHEKRNKLITVIKIISLKHPDFLTYIYSCNTHACFIWDILRKVMNYSETDFFLFLNVLVKLLNIFWLIWIRLIRFYLGRFPLFLFYLERLQLILW